MYPCVVILFISSKTKKVFLMYLINDKCSHGVEVVGVAMAAAGAAGAEAEAEAMAVAAMAVGAEVAAPD